MSEAGIEVWRGSVNAWECDQMGHMNVRFYVARALEGLVGLAAAMDLPGAFRPSAEATLTVRDQHMRFLREARAGAALFMQAGVVELGECDARLLQLLYHAESGELAASFQTLVSHATAGDGRVFPWSLATREKAQALIVPIPDRAQPRSLKQGAPGGNASIAAANQMSLIRLAAGAFDPGDCDAFGAVRPDVLIGRIADGVPTLGAALSGSAAPEPSTLQRGGAVLEYRLSVVQRPRAGDRFEVRSGLMGFDDRAQHLAHWVLDPESGAPWATSEAIAISLDLQSRKIIPLSEDAKSRLGRHVRPGLSL